MDPLHLILRVVHIVSGTIWVGMMFFNVFFLAPAVREAGPEGAKVMSALQRRGLMNVTPAIALLTLVSGIWLIQRAWGGMSGVMGTPMGQAFAAGGFAALLAFLLGILLMRPAMLRAAALAQTIESASSQQDRAQRMQKIERLRSLASNASLAAAFLLILAVGAMSVARYMA